MPSARTVRRVLVLSVVAAAVVDSPGSRSGAGAHPAALAPHQQLLREIYQELIEINTTNSVGDNTKAAEAMARRLLNAGFPAADVQVLAPAPRKGNMVARLRGTGARRPLLLLAHLDVVEANREDWSVDPFKLLEQDGYFYGRGTTDDKAMAAAFVDNVIWHLAGGLARLAEFDFPVNLDDVNRQYFERSAALIGGSLGDDFREVANGNRDPAVVARVAAVGPVFNSRLRTTCVPTRLEGGHADNALPQTARAVVNCRVLPGETEEDVRQTLIRVLANDPIKVTPVNKFFPSPASPLTAEIMGAVERVTQALWPGVPVIPTMSTGTTDSRYLRTAGIPAYGTSGMFGDIDDIRAHGRDERMLVQSLYEGQEYLYRLVKLLSSRP